MDKRRFVNYNVFMDKGDKEFLGKKLLVFTAHPDDEQLAAGTMYENHKAGGKTFLVCVTAGEKGRSHLKYHISDAGLKRLRKNELLAAAKVLHINKVIFLGLPDAGLRAKEKILYKKCYAITKKLKPEYILSFGPDGISGHWDHITVGKIARKVAKQLKIPLAAFTFSNAMRTRLKKQFFLNRRKFGAYAGVPKHRKGDIIIAIDAKVKRRAMSFHKSQFGDRGLFPELPKRVSDKFFLSEHFIRERTR